MANISNYLEEALLNHMMRGQAGGTSYNQPGNVYVGLITNTATDNELESGDLTNEVTAYDGNRKEIIFTEPVQIDGKATITNIGNIDFENMPAETIKYAIICDNNTGGNILYWCPALQIKTTNEGDTYRIPDGDLTIDLD